ncbi:hypothetical protein BKA61DRAFT_615054 [Leptodontidium sp. MPI-SDFR-AT-0119]|nr:hypothetical protein BKA61DRAFT_615054 [Leptodontidium sp. MPI-SDFR-AT-0119]
MSIPSYDIERQTVPQHNGAKAGRLFLSFWSSLSSGQSEVPLLLRSESRASFSDRAGQYCFLCLQGKKTGQYAVQVLCMRPTRPRAITGHKLIPKDDIFVKIPGSEIYEKLNPKELACESDAAIYQRLQDTCFQFQGTWKRWLPFYGVVDVREVNFQFVGVVERDGRFPIHILPSNVNQVRDDADRVISLSPDDLDIDFGEACWDEGHSTRCQRMAFGPCINVQIEAARQRKKKLTLVHLLRDCARNPCSANGLHTLDGMAQDSCILDIE